mgnify:CR=1 FL=1
MSREMNIKEGMRKIGIGLGLVIITVVLTTLAIVIFSHDNTNNAPVNANTTKHARIVLNGQVVKEGKAKGYDYHAGMNGHTMTVQFEDGTEATSSPNNIVVWSE